MSHAGEQGGPERPEHDRRFRLTQIALLSAVPLFVGIAGWLRRWMSDDGFIYVRIVQNVLAGHGAVYNPGERIETGTDPIWVYLLAGTKWIVRWVSIEYVSVVISIAFIVIALVAMQLSSRRLWGSPGKLYVPFGSLVVASIAAYWDYTTSGLDTALVLAWIGVSVATLLWFGSRTDQLPWQTWPIAGLIGLGWLIRPDIWPYAGLLTVSLVTMIGFRRFRVWILVVGASIAMPLVYLIFRAGYYGALLPTSAIAKGTDVRWSQGFAFVVDFIGRYALIVALMVLAIGFVLIAFRSPWMSQRPHRLVIFAVLLSAAVQTTFIIRLGGGFMHARLLLPVLFVVCLPLAVVPWERKAALPLIAMVAWSLVAVVALRPGIAAGPNGWIVDEREFYVQKAQVAHPVRIDDVSANPWHTAGLYFAQRADAVGVPTLSLPPEDGGDRSYHEGWEIRADPGWLPFSYAVSRASIGIPAAAASLDVHIVDHLGLADPIAARMRVEKPGRPGHEKVYPIAWVAARFAADGEPLPPYLDQGEVAAAERALACEPLAALIRGVTEPLTMGRFLENMRSSIGWTFLRLPPDPGEAADELCP